MLIPANKNAANKGNNDNTSFIQKNNDNTSTKRKDYTKAMKLSNKNNGNGKMTQTNESSKSAFNRSGDGVTPPRSGVTGITKDNMATESPSTSKLNISDTTTVLDGDSMDIDPHNKVYTKKSISKAGKYLLRIIKAQKRPKLIM